MDPSFRFWLKVYRNRSYPCWEWLGCRDTPGYGQLSVNGKTVKAHRLSWELHKGKIPPGIYVLHHCDNRLCVRPSHLFLGTHRDNVDDMLRKERQSRGITHSAKTLAGLARRKKQGWRRDGRDWVRVGATPPEQLAPSDLAELRTLGR